MLRIGEFSKLSRVSVKALRFYDEIGLFKPTYVDGVTGYRFYAANSLGRLNRILIFKEMGFSLEEVALLSQTDVSTDDLCEALRTKRAELSRRIAHDQERLEQLESLLMQIKQQGHGPDYEIILKQVSPQLVASVRDTVRSYDETAELFAELDCHLRKRNTVGQIAGIWHNCAGHGQQIDCEAVAFLNYPLPGSKRVRVYELPASVNACLVHQGSDETITGAYVAARSWIEMNNYAIAGPLCELYWQGGVARNNGPGVTEIRYPIVKPPLVAASH